MVEMKNADRRDSVVRKSGLRCPACLLVQDFTVKDFICTLTRCPRVFVRLDPPAGGQSGPPSSNTGTAKSVATPEPLAEELAIVDSGGGALDEIAVNRFRSLLNQLSDKYMGGEKRIADQTVTTQKIFKQKGIAESLRNIMESTNQVLPPGTQNQRYDGTLAMYISLRDQGSSHVDAVQSLQESIQEFASRPRLISKL